jgi:PST family polysaccharide transporter
MSFSRILKSSAMLAGAQTATLITAFIRSKLIAIVTGPSGIGLVGVMTAFNGNVTALASWGLGTSGVRLINSSNDADRPRNKAAVRRFGLIVSAAGLLLTLILFWPVSAITFHQENYAAELLIAGMAVPCLIATTTWTSILQADGHVKSLAKLQLVSAVAGLALGAPLIFMFGTVGIAWGVLLASAVPALATWWIARRLCPPDGVAANARDMETMVKLGGGLVVVGLASQAAAYVVRLVIIRHYEEIGGDGLAAAGYYQAAIAVAGSLPAVVFGAMGTNFFPLVSAAKDEAEAQMLSENQMQAGLLLALPLLTALLTMSEVGLRLLYDDRFEPAGPLLCWMIWGVFLRLLAWPLGYWMLARGSIRLVVVVESFSNLVMVLLPLILVPAFGVLGAAHSFAASYVVYALIMLIISRHRSGRWISSEVLLWFFAGGIWMAGMQFLCHLAGGGWWGVLPTAIIGLICAAIYFRKIRNETLSRHG